MQELDDNIVQQMSEKQSLRLNAMLGAFCCGSIKDGPFVVSQFSSKDSAQDTYVIVQWR